MFTNKAEAAAGRAAPGAAIIHGAIRLEGEEELSRSSQALAWSGLAAGLAMGASLLAQGVLHSYLADVVWRHLVVSLGYTAGFLIVVLGRQQLFTENTLNVVIPLLDSKKMKVLKNVGRLWLVVLLANLAGAWLFAWFLSSTSACGEHLKHSLTEVSRKGVLVGGASTVFFRAIIAGWLIALMVWMLPAADSSRFFVVLLISYLVGAGSLSHIIAGAVEVFYLLHRDVISWGNAFGGYLLPALAGNTLGGVALVAILNHAQVVSGKKLPDV